MAASQPSFGMWHPTVVPTNFEASTDDDESDAEAADAEAANAETDTVDSE